MNGVQTAGHAYALLADGTSVEIRLVGPADFDAVKAMHEAMSPDNTYARSGRQPAGAGADQRAPGPGIDDRQAR